MKHLVVLVVALFSSCEWEEYHNNTPYVQTDYNWINLSGTYRSQSNSPLIPNSTTAPIVNMLVQQSGNQLDIIDSNGDRYTGVLTDISSTTGSGQVGTSSQVGMNNMILAPFRMQGVGSRANVMIIGTFLGNYSVQNRMSFEEILIRQRLGQQVNINSDTVASLLNRTMTGTWIEYGPTGEVFNTGDIIGLADTFVSN